MDSTEHKFTMCRTIFELERRGQHIRGPHI